jgi:O-antigen ligase
VTVSVLRPGGFPRRSTGAEAVREPASLRTFRILLAAFVLVAVTKVHEAVPQLGIIPWVKLSGIVMIAAAMSVIPGTRFRAMMRTPTARWVQVIVILAVVGAPFALWKGQSVDFLINVFWKPLLLFVVAAAAFADSRTMRMAIIAFLAGAAVAAVRVASGAATSALDGGIARFAMGGTFDPNESALLFLVAIPFALGLAGERRQGRLGWYVVALLMVAGIVRTGSRAGFLGLCALGAWWTWRSLNSRRGGGGTILIVLGAAAVFSMTASPQLRERFTSVFSPSEDYNFTSRDGRWQIWQRGMRYMLHNPLLGVGIANFPIAEGDIGGKVNEGYGIKYSAAHNSFIEIGAELGILGLIAFTGMLWTAYDGCRRLRRYPPGAVPSQLAALGIATEGALLAFVVTGSFLSFAYQMVTFFLVALALGIRLATRVAVPDTPPPQGVPAGMPRRGGPVRWGPLGAPPPRSR